jgi:ribose transport system substrate-binding protein
MRKIVFLYVSLITVMIILWYTFYPSANPTSPWGTIKTGISGSIEEKYIMITYDSGEDYWKNAFKGFEDAAEALNVSVDFAGTANYDASELAVQLEQIIGKKPSGIVVAGIDSPEVLDALNKATANGIPLIAIDTELNSDKFQSFLGMDNYETGAQAARKMASQIGKRGDVAVIFDQLKKNEQLREEGFVDTLKKEFPNIRIVKTADGNGNRTQSRDLARVWINRYPALQGVFTTDPEIGMGVADASEYYNKKSINIITFDSDIQVLNEIGKGVITTTIVQDTWNMGYWALFDLFHLHHNLLNVSEHEERNTPLLPKKVYVGSTFITKDNVKHFFAK